MRQSRSKRADKRVDGPWRLGLEGESEHASGGLGFDELVVGDWLHVEKMNHAHYWMRIGDSYAIDVLFDHRGRVSKVVVSKEGA